MNSSNKKKGYNIFFVAILLVIVILILLIGLSKKTSNGDILQQVQIKQSADTMDSGKTYKEIQASEIKPNLNFKSLPQTDE